VVVAEVFDLGGLRSSRLDRPQIDGRAGRVDSDIYSLDLPSRDDMTTCIGGNLACLLYQIVASQERVVAFILYT
jgi:hypothetical protein